ncbi:hypothetical protein TRFO_19545 [Tritrichomonas foetus]|uniref:EF-hand domain-containing protein n=1 Tax=Tritrichomonas foetus TaxID=1144522 RepID=A0A1J4KHU8_9EUKA|nr:hypothetical protein TRFO_19545 [Tritrichomonas foetus]|eukprot:OHT10967.1 hypothetical protein TRFO_19545 [Tritrichomonas foetus]
MEQIKPITVVCCESIKGRQAPIAGTMKNRQNGSLFQTPNLPFETRDSEPSFTIRKPIIPKRSQTTLDKPKTSKTTKYREGHYAMCFEDSTWAHTDPNATDHYASREEILDVAQKFDTQVEAIISADEIEQASGLQSATDMLLDELATMLRAECREQCELVERARGSYAAVFSLLRDDSQKCREVINDLESQKSILDENLTKVIDNATERVKETQLDCERQITEMRAEMDEKKEEYDNSMKRFLEQKSQLEEHVKALHRVFLDFQSDSVYITLEELKQKQQQYEKKLRNKETEISKLKSQLSKLQKTIMDGENGKAMVEQANDELRRKLQLAMAQKNRLQRRLDMQNMGNEDMEQENYEQDELGEVTFNSDGLPNKPLISSENVMNSAQGIQFHRNRKDYISSVDSAPYITVMQKLGQITDRITDFLTRTPSNLILPQSINDETDKIMLSGNASLMIKAIQMKANEVLQLTECFENLESSNNATQRIAKGTVSEKSVPRFLQYIRAHNQPGNTEKEQKFTTGTLLTLRQILNAKYLSDRWNHRMNHPMHRFPEFVISFFCKDGENMFTALSRAARLWRAIQKNKTPEVKMFRGFLKETLTIDELSFFLEARHSLLGMRNPQEDDPQIITVQYKKCQEFMTSILGAFSPILTTVSQESEKYCVNGYIDYSQFLIILTSFYQSERRRRRNAVRLMFQSKNLGNGEVIDFETFVGMIQSLGFQGAMNDIFSLYREAALLGGGDLTLDSLLHAMDSLSFHFYTIEIPISITKKLDLTQLSRQQLLQHWIRFGSWFSAFRQPMPEFDSWLKSQLVAQVRKVDQVFKANEAIPVLYTEYRQLLDFFQFALDILARSQKVPMPPQKSERHLSLLENIIDLLVTFIMRDGDGEISFTEAL